MREDPHLRDAWFALRFGQGPKANTGQGPLAALEARDPEGGGGELSMRIAISDSGQVRRDAKVLVLGACSCGGVREALGEWWSGAPREAHARGRHQGGGLGSR